jgi:hypothetical protein
MTRAWKDWKTLVRRDAIAEVRAAGAAPNLPATVCAALVSLSYKDQEDDLQAAMTAPGWRYLGDASPEESGYDGAALLHEPSGTLIALNRGTELSRSLSDVAQTVAAAILDLDLGQIHDAVTFAASAWIDPAAEAPKRFKALGHSLGGGLAEAQVAFLPDAVRAAGGQPPVSISGLGIASVGFKDALRGFGERRGWALQHARVAEAMTHFLRKEDVVERLRFTDRIGSRTFIASAYETQFLTADNGRSRVWKIEPDEIRNHEPLLYYRFLGVDEDLHLVWRWSRSKDVQTRAGAKPQSYQRTQPPDADL